MAKQHYTSHEHIKECIDKQDLEKLYHAIVLVAQGLQQKHRFVSQDQASEASHDVATKILYKVRNVKVKPNKSLFAYVTSCVRNEFLHSLRKPKNHKRFLEKYTEHLKGQE